MDKFGDYIRFDWAIKRAADIRGGYGAEDDFSGFFCAEEKIFLTLRCRWRS